MNGDLIYLRVSSSIVYYRLSLVSLINFSSLSVSSMRWGYIPTDISTTSDLVTPIASESRTRVSKNGWSHLILNVLSFVITFFLSNLSLHLYIQNCHYILFVHTKQLSLHFCHYICNYIYLSLHFIRGISSCIYNISTISGLSRGKTGFVQVIRVNAATYCSNTR
jgi:hypothetical protein